MTSGNPILDKNLEVIEEYNPALKEKLLNLPYLTNDIQLVETSLKEPNLTYNGLPLHSPNGAELEAKTLFAKSDDSILSTHFILGMGLGHLFKEFCERSKGRIILYECNLEILRVTLELVDFSKELSQNNVKIASDYKELKDMFTMLYDYKADVNFSILDSYRVLYGAEAQEILNKAEFINSTFFIDYKKLQETSFDNLTSVMDNLPYIVDSTPLYEIKDTYKNKTALIISAGPTLDLNIESIKKNRDKVVIFCVGTAIKTLISKGITPDFLNVVEMFDCSGQISGLDLSDVYAILDVSTHSSFYSAKTKHKFLFPQQGSPWGNYWCDLAGVDVSKYLSRGSVSFQAMSSAKMLGCNRIVLVGQDLAYVNNSCYSKDSAYSELFFEINPETGKIECKAKDYEKYRRSVVPVGVDVDEPWCIEFAETKLKQTNENLCFIDGILGEKIPTDGAYALFVEFFKDFAINNKELDLINTSMIGAQIDGFENIELDKALERAEEVGRIEVSHSLCIDKRRVADRLESDVKYLHGLLDEIEKGIIYLSKYEREVMMRKLITEPAKRFYQNIMQIYDKLTLDDFKKSELYRIISFAEHIEVQYVFKKGMNLSVEEKIRDMHSTVKDYFYNIQRKLLVDIDKIEKNVEMLSK